MKVRLWSSLLIVSTVVMVALAVVVPRWNAGTTASGASLGMFIDANTGDGTCDLPPDSARSVAHPASFDVAICVEDPPTALGVFAFELVYDDTLIVAPEVANAAPALDDNPDANQAALGTGWDCSGFGLAFPRGDVDAAGGPGHGRAKLGCLSLAGPWTFTSTGHIGLVHFNTQGVESTTSLALENVTLGDAPGNEIGTCNPAISVPMPCVDGSVTVTGGVPPATATQTPTVTPTATVAPTPTITPTPRPFACLWEDDLGKGTTLGIRGDWTGTWVFTGPGLETSGGSSRLLGTSRIVVGRSGGVRVFGIGKCPNGPARAFAFDMSGFPFRMFSLVDMSR
jgi:hypothetical protein